MSVRLRLGVVLRPICTEDEPEVDRRILCLIASGNPAPYAATPGRYKRNKDLHMVTPGSSSVQLGLYLSLREQGCIL